MKVRLAKKTVSILLSVLMAFSAFAGLSALFAASALEPETCGHEWIETAKEGDCIDGFTLYYECQICGAKKTEDEDGPGEHTWIVSATHGSCRTRYTRDLTCEICGATSQDNELDENAHDYREDCRSGSCPTGLEIHYSCSFCGDEYIEVLDPADHVDEDRDGLCDACGEDTGEPPYDCMMDGHIYNDPVWTWDGVESAQAVAVCSMCENEFVAVDENPVEVEVSPASCADDRVVKYVATVYIDGVEYSNETEDIVQEGTALEHAWYEADSEGNCIDGWTVHQICELCGAESTYHYDGPGEHTDEDGDGVCDVCHETIDPCAENGHSCPSPIWNWNGVTEAVATFSCELCGESFDVTDSNPVETEVSPASCAGDRVVKYVATVEYDGQEYSDETADIVQEGTALEHEWGDVSYFDIVCGEGWNNVYQCLACGAEKTEFEPDPDAHAYYEADSEGNCIDGWTVHQICELCGAESTYHYDGPGEHTDRDGDGVCDVCHERLGVPVITLQPVSAEAAVGATAYFTVEAAGDDLQYQWQCSVNGGRNWSNSGFSTAKSATLKVPVTAARNGYEFRCVVTGANGSAVSDAAILTVATAITAQPESAVKALGDTATFSVVASGAAPLAYQWEYSFNGGRTWSDSRFSTAKSAALKVPVTAARNGYEFRCVVTGANGSAVSESAGLTVATVITAQPEPAVKALDETATFTVGASGAVPLAYQWEYSFNGGRTWSDSGFSTAKSATLKVPVTAARDGYEFRCVVTGSDGSVVSEPAGLTVATEITSQPESAVKALGDTATFSVVASGSAPLAYQWQYSFNGGRTWSDSRFSTAKSAALKVPATAARDGYEFRCVVTGSNGQTAISDAATLTVS